MQISRKGKSKAPATQVALLLLLLLSQSMSTYKTNYWFFFSLFTRTKINNQLCTNLNQIFTLLHLLQNLHLEWTVVVVVQELPK